MKSSSICKLFFNEALSEVDNQINFEKDRVKRLGLLAANARAGSKKQLYAALHDPYILRS